MILIDQLKQIYIEGELEPIDTTVWYNKIQRKDYQVGMNLTGVGIDDPDVNFYENYYSTSDRNYTGYKNPEVDKLIDQQSAEPDREKRKKIVWEIEKKLAEDGARPMIGYNVANTCWTPQMKGVAAAGQQHLQRLAFRRRLAGSVGDVMQPPPTTSLFPPHAVARCRRHTATEGSGPSLRCA